MIVDAIEADWPLIEALAERAEVFSEEELDALSAVLEEFALLGPEDSGYDFLVDRVDGRILGFVVLRPARPHRRGMRTLLLGGRPGLPQTERRPATLEGRGGGSA